MNLPERKKFNDADWSEEAWKDLLGELIGQRLLSWKDIAILVLGHMNPSQVGTNLASSAGFKRQYGKGNVMTKVMEWFYEQNGRCHDCGTRLELQADHNKPREEYDDPLDADFIENMVLRCRRCNVIKRPSHKFGGRTHLTTEAALMWILFNFRPRTLPDFVRMCRLYGLTMAGIRVQEGWAMAHWLRKVETVRYVIDTDDTPCQVLRWPDGGITRCWHNDNVLNKDQAQVLCDDALPSRDIIALAYLPHKSSTKVSVHMFRYPVGHLPFSHYFSGEDAESLAITYSSPNRKKNNSSISIEVDTSIEEAVQEDIAFKDLDEASEVTTAEQIADLPEAVKINYMPPRGMIFLDANFVNANDDALIRWDLRGKVKEISISPKIRGKKICNITAAELHDAQFIIV